MSSLLANNFDTCWPRTCRHCLNNNTWRLGFLPCSMQVQTVPGRLQHHQELFNGT
jgi:hypothetical protein